MIQISDILPLSRTLMSGYYCGCIYTTRTCCPSSVSIMAGLTVIVKSL